MSNHDIIEWVLARWHKYHGIRAGERNGNLYILAADLNNYGIPHADALQVCLQFEDRTGADPLTAHEITQVVGSAYRRTTHASKTWVPRGQYRPAGPCLPSPWKLADEGRAAMVAKVLEAWNEEDAQRAVPPQPAQAPAPSPSPSNAEVLPPTGKDIFLRMAERNNALFTLADALGLDMENATPRNSEGGSAPNAYPLSPSRHGRVGTPQR
jgi:hypothetical protein